MRRLVLAGSMLAAVVMAGCSSSSSSSNGGDSGNGDTPVNVTADQACTDAIAALCTEIQKCAPFVFDAYYLDLPTCESRLAIGCASGFTTPGEIGTPAQLDACAQVVPSIACPDFLGGLNGTGLHNSLQSQSACNPVAGTLANGTACAGDGQCSSAFCATDKNAFCGTCAAAPAAGDACNAGSCGTGLVCSGSGKCAKPGNAGDACGNDASCSATLLCYNGICTVGGKSGDTCDLSPSAPTAPNCDVFSGLGCQLAVPPTSFVGKCAAIKEAHTGDACNLLKLEYCVGGAFCSGWDQSNPTKDGTCIAPADDGAACDNVKGPTCKPAAKCIGGVCKVSDPTSCK